MSQISDYFCVKGCSNIGSEQRFKLGLHFVLTLLVNQGLLNSIGLYVNLSMPAACFLLLNFYWRSTCISWWPWFSKCDGLILVCSLLFSCGNLFALCTLLPCLSKDMKISFAEVSIRCFYSLRTRSETFGSTQPRLVQWVHQLKTIAYCGPENESEIDLRATQATINIGKCRFESPWCDSASHMQGC